MYNRRHHHVRRSPAIREAQYTARPLCSIAAPSKLRSANTSSVVPLMSGSLTMPSIILRADRGRQGQCEACARKRSGVYWRPIVLIRMRRHRLRVHGVIVGATPQSGGFYHGKVWKYQMPRTGTGIRRICVYYPVGCIGRIWRFVIARADHRECPWRGASGVIVRRAS